ncbi:MAG: transposase, partial [Deltaproteobacteria bacterium]|nr:transposase [Deltaproteobacteria bacterium]
MVRAPPRREAVRFLHGFQVSPRRGGALLKIGWSSYRYVAHPRDDGPLKERLREIARKHPRYGYRRAWALLVRAGEVINPKRVYRLWKQEGLLRPQIRRKPRHKPAGVAPLNPTTTYLIIFYADGRDRSDNSSFESPEPQESESLCRILEGGAP